MILEVILIMRTYALYERNKRILAFMIVVTLAAVAFALVSCYTFNLLQRHHKKIQIILIMREHNRNMLDFYLKTVQCPSPTPHNLCAMVLSALHVLNLDHILPQEHTCVHICRSVVVSVNADLNISIGTAAAWGGMV
jgi:hypothetical protein